MKKNITLFLIVQLAITTFFSCKNISDETSVLIQVDNKALYEYVDTLHKQQNARNTLPIGKNYTLNITLMSPNSNIPYANESAKIGADETKPVVLRFTSIPINTNFSIKATVSTTEINTDDSTFIATPVTYLSGTEKITTTSGDNYVNITLKQMQLYTINLKEIDSNQEETTKTLTFSADSSIFFPSPKNLEYNSWCTESPSGLFTITKQNGKLQIKAEKLINYCFEPATVTLFPFYQEQQVTPGTADNYYMELKLYNYDTENTENTVVKMGKNTTGYYYKIDNNQELFTNGTNVWQRNIENNETEWQQTEIIYTEIINTINSMQRKELLSSLEYLKTMGLVTNDGNETVSGYNCSVWIIYNVDNNGSKTTPSDKIVIQDEYEFMTKYYTYDSTNSNADEKGFVLENEVTLLKIGDYNWTDYNIDIPN